MDASGHRLAAPKLSGVLNRMGRAAHGYRRLARDYLHATGQPMTRSAAQRFLARPPPVAPPSNPMARPLHPRVEFGADYFEKWVVGGGKLYVLNVVDHYNSGVAALDRHYRESAWATVATLERLRERAPPRATLLVHVDNGSPFDNDVVKAHCRRRRILLDFIPKGQPWKNAFVERANRTLQEEYLNLRFVGGRKSAQVLLEEIREAFNARENMSLGYRAPAELWNTAPSGPAPSAPVQPALAVEA